jgi:hypothetical protein
MTGSRERQDLAHFTVAHQLGLTIAGIVATVCSFGATLEALHLWSRHTTGIDAAELGIKIAAGVAAGFAAIIAVGRFEPARIAEIRAGEAADRLERRFTFDREGEIIRQASELHSAAVSQIGSNKP